MSARCLAERADGDDPALGRGRVLGPAVSCDAPTIDTPSLGTCSRHTMGAAG